MSEPKRYEYVSDGYTARFINPKTGHAAPKGEYVECEDYARLVADFSQMTAWGRGLESDLSWARAELLMVKAEVERLTKAVMHSPAAQLKLKELEGKNTYEEINPKEGKNARLKAEVELWKLRSDNWQKFCELTRPEMTDELTRLKQEVERLTERLGGVRLIVTEEMYDELNTKYLEQQHELQNIALTARQILDEKIDLKAEVERLTKAGDAMAEDLIGEFGSYNSVYDWNAAKEGKQS